MLDKMCRSVFALSLMGLIVGFSFAFTEGINAQGRSGVSPFGRAQDEGPANGDLKNQPGGSKDGSLARGEEVSVMIELDDPATVQVYAREKHAYADREASFAEAQAATSAQMHLGRVERAQQELLPSLASPNINAKVLYRVQRVYNGIAVRVAPSMLPEIRRLPGVKAVHPLIPKEASLQSSVPLIGAPALWNNLGLNATGKGLRIGIIDSGIDYLHTDFGGPGAGYADNDPTKIGDVPGFPGVKVVGGYDFVGDQYDSRSSDPEKYIANPDPDPMDCMGHGTLVAGIAGGFGVNADGAPYVGPYGPGTSFSSLKIGPGVAPEAKLYALKVFGCSGSTLATAQAIEWAMDPNGDGNFSDHLDVVNLSIGAAYWTYPEDPDQVASDNAALAGMITVWAAGNDGDAFFITGGHSARSIVAAASVNSAFTFDGFRVNAPAPIATIYLSSNSTKYDWAGMKGTVTGTLAFPAGQSGGCEAFNPANAGLLAGKVALLDWTDDACGSETRTNNAANAGAIGVIFAYNHPSLEVFAGIAGSDRIPATITTQAIGNLLKANLSSGVGVTLGKEWQNSQKIVNSVFTDTLPDYTSRGPSTGNALLKPDITAPGQTIFTADAGTGTGGLPGNGTSSAAPHIAGAMALLRQIHPNWSVEELKALAMNTATHDLFTGPDSTPPKYAPSRVGAGRIDLGNAGASDVIAFCTDDPGAVSVSFGGVEVVGSLTRTKTVKVVNKGATAKTFSLGYDAITEVPGVNFSFPGVTSLTVPAGGAITFPVELSATASLMKHTHDPAVSETMAGLPRHWLSEKSGYIILASGSGPGLRLPVYAAARPASAMGTGENQIVMNAAAGAVNLTLSGQGVNTGTSYPLDEISLVSPLELQYISQNEASSAGAQNGADLKYIGVTSDYKVRAAKGQGVADTVIQFGLTTHGDWSSPNEHGYLLFVDSNRDGLDDYEVKLDYASGARDLFGIWAYPLPNGSGRFQFYLNGFSAAQYNTVPFNTNIMVLPVKASDIGLSETRTRFNYRVETYLGGQLIDKSDTLTYDVVRPGLHLLGDFLGPFAYYDTDGNAIPVQYNRDNYLANGSKGLLLLHHHNAGGSRAQLLAVIDGIGLETVSIPNRPSGPADGLAGTSYSYVTAGSVSSLGHTIEYQFDWKGDGTDLSSWGPSAQSKTWSAEGAYNVRVRARCSKDTSFISDWSAVLGVNITPIPPNLTPYKPSKWSDRIVVSTTKGAKTDSSSLATTDTLYVNWALINSGNGPTTVRFWTELYVDDEMRGRWYGDPPLKPGDSFSVVDYSIGSLKEGTHEIRIVIDPDDDQAESNDWDNDYVKTVTVSVAGPDLTGEWVSPPSQTCKGSGSSQKCKIAGSLRVENIGNRDVVTTSYVEFYLEGEIEDTLMKRISVGKLKKGKSSIVKLSYSLPTGANAQGKYVLAMIDADDAVGEIDEDNNLIFYEEIP